MSRTLPFLLGVAVGALVAGAGVFVLVAPTADPASDDALAEANGSVRPPEGGAPAAGAPAQTSRPRARRDASVPSAADVDTSDIPLPAGATGKITGHVFDAAGRGLPGVSVTASPRATAPAIVEPDTSDLDEILRRQIRDAVRERAFEVAWRRHAVTDDAGAFVLDGIDDQAWSVWAELGDWDFDEVARSGTELRPGVSVAFRGARLPKCMFALVASNGAAPERGTIDFESERGERTRDDQWTPALPWSLLGNGRWTARAKAGADGELRSAPVTFDVPRPADAPPIVLRLDPVPGVVVDIGPPPPFACRWVYVSLTPSDDTKQNAPPTSDGSPRDWPDREQLAPSGRASWTDIVPGTWTLTATNGLGQELHSETLQVGRDVVRRRIDIPDRDLRDYVDVQVSAPDGTPAADLDFFSGWAEPDGPRLRRVDAFPIGGCTWRVAFEAEGERPPSEQSDAAPKWLVEVESSEWGSVRAEFDGAQFGAVRALRFAAPAFVVFQVEGERPDDVRLRVELEEPARTPRDSAREQVLSGGKARFGPLALQRATFSLSMLDHDDNSVTAHLGLYEVDLVAGDNTVSLRIPPLQTLAVTTGDDTPIDELRLERENDGSSRYRWTGAGDPIDGVWSRLVPGSYRLVSREGAMHVRIPGPRAVRFTATLFDAARIESGGGDEPDASGLRDGDLVTAIDGTEFKGARQIYALFAAAEAKPSARFTLRRDGREMEIEIDVSARSVRWDYDIR